MESIAAAAEVGVGTLYRRFPHKADLFDAVVRSATEQTRQIAEQVLTQVPPAECVFEFFRRCVAVPSCWRATISAPPWSTGANAALEETVPLLEAILDKSRQAGTVRDDLQVPDLVVTLMAVRSIADLCDAVAPDAALRFLELALDGLRPGNQSPRHPPITVSELGQIFGRS
jgi:AcrR family transcriptional regulator